MGVPTIGSDNILGDPTHTFNLVPAADPLFPIANISDDRVSVGYKPGSAATEVRIEIDTATTENCDYFALVGHDLFDPAQDGLGPVDLRIERSDNGSSWNPVFGPSTVTSNKIIFLSTSTHTRRYFRLRLNRASAFIPTIGIMHFGKALEFPQGMKVGFDPQQEKINSHINRSATGQILGGVQTYTQRKATIDFDFLTNDFIRDKADSFTVFGFRRFWDLHASLGRPFFFAWDPGASGSDFAQDAMFCSLEPNAQIQRPLRSSVDLGLRNLRFNVVAMKEC